MTPTKDTFAINRIHDRAAETIDVVSDLFKDDPGKEAGLLRLWAAAHLVEAAEALRDKELQHVLSRSYTHADVADVFGVTKQAISAKLVRGGQPKLSRRPRVKGEQTLPGLGPSTEVGPVA